VLVARAREGRFELGIAHGARQWQVIVLPVADSHGQPPEQTFPPHAPLHVSPEAHSVGDGLHSKK
jgi:hypothetical protein